MNPTKIIASLCISSAALAADIPKNPYQDEKVYQEACEAFPSNRIDPEMVAKSRFPTWGIMVSEIDPGGPAEKAGMPIGFMIGSVNGHECYNRKIPFRDLAQDSPEIQISGTAPDGSEHTYSFKKGKRIGLSVFNFYLYEQYLYKNIPHGKWDKDMLVVPVATQYGNYPLATAALERALKAGMPENQFSTYYKSLFAFTQGDLKTSKEQLSKLLKQLPQDHTKTPRFFIPGLSSLALAYQDFKLLKDINKELDGLESEFSQESFQSWVNWADGKIHPSLYEKAKTTTGSNITGELNYISDNWQGDWGNYILSNLHSGSMGMRLNHNYFAFMPMCHKEPIHDAIWEFRLSVGNDYGLDYNPDGFSKATFALLDKQGASEAGDIRDNYAILSHYVAGISLWHDESGERYVRMSGGLQNATIGCILATPLISNEDLQQIPKNGSTNAPILSPKSSSDKITLIRIGNEAEILINDCSVLHVPVDPKVKDLGFVIYINGEGFAIKDMTLRPIQSTTSTGKN